MGTYTKVFDTKLTNNGPHTVYAVIKDTSNNTTTTPSITLQVQNKGKKLVTAYAFNEGAGTTVQDFSDSGHSAQVVGSAWNTGKYDGALQFDGITAKVFTPHSEDLQFTDGMTVEAWVFLTTYNLADYRDIVTKDDSFYLFSNTGTNVPGGGIIVGETECSVADTVPLPLNTWSHLAMLYDGSSVKLYVNGILKSSTPAQGTIATSTSSLGIGFSPKYGSFFQGKIDEVRLYNYARTAQEIQTDMNSSIAPSVPVPPQPTPPKLTVTAPAAGAIWRLGQTNAIKYTRTNVPGPLRMELVRDEQSSIIVNSTTNTSSINWKVATSQSKWKIKITSIDNPLIAGWSGSFSIFS